MPALTVAHENSSPRYPVSQLRLDTKNPRLPVSQQGKTQSVLLGYLFKTASLQELAQSFIDNDFFEHEPLLVLPENRGSRVVVEGNRRLATLMILLELPSAHGLHFLGLEMSQDKRREFQEVPVHEVASHEEVATFLGYRHIGGIRTWGAEARARFVYEEILKVAGDDPIATIAHRFGLDKPSVRAQFLAFALLKRANDLGVDTSTLLDHEERRFGVWIRAMQSKDIREYIGLKEISNRNITRAIGALNKRALKEVIKDIAPPPGLPLVLSDSRQVTLYGRILRNPQAQEEMRRTSSLDAAKTIVDSDALPVRLEKIVRSLSRIADDILGADKNDAIGIKEQFSSLEAAVERIQRALRGIE